MPPVQTNLVVAVLLMIVVITACDSKEEKDIPEQLRKDKRGIRSSMAVMPVLGIRG